MWHVTIIDFWQVASLQAAHEEALQKLAASHEESSAAASKQFEEQLETSIQATKEALQAKLQATVDREQEARAHATQLQSDLEVFWFEWN